MTQTLRLPFRGGEIVGLVRDDGSRWVSIYRICRHLGLPYEVYAGRLGRSGFDWADFPVDGQVTRFVARHHFEAWVISLDIGDVSSRYHALCREYQKNGADLMGRLFRDGAAISPEFADDPDMQQLAILMKVKAEQKRQALQIAATSSELEHVKLHVGARTGYYSVRAWARLHKRDLPLSAAQRDGVNLARVCRDLGLPIGTVPDERHGEVNSYPERVLRDYYPWSRC